MELHAERILILDFGSQYTQLIARRVREAGVYCELHNPDIDAGVLHAFAPRGVILSGGPESTTFNDTPRVPQAVFELGVPVLGICYGMHTMAAQLGGRVEASSEREFGYARLRVADESKLFAGIEDHVDTDGSAQLDVWMSHGDRVAELPEGFCIAGISDNAPVAAMADDSRHFYGIQFHPEVTHTVQGTRLLRRFVR
jgi:GMP synthase (glutamine-hydrolysing)